jgi:anti-sigma regulatory factor (Ser/Thr protein kinase)
VLHRYCEFRELPSNIVFAITLSLDEVITNVISYGYDDHDEHHINVTLRSGKGVIEISVEDDGKPFNPLEFKTPDLKCPIDERPIGGLGIYLVKTYMNELKYDRAGGKNRLTMRKNL